MNKLNNMIYKQNFKDKNYIYLEIINIKMKI